MILAALLTGVLGGMTWWSLRPVLPSGDEPHYLVIAQSLLRDGDLRIENNHERRDYAEYFGQPLRPDYINRGRNGEIYSIHAPGVSALVLPGFAFAGLFGAQFTIWLCLVVTGTLIWRLAWNATQDGSAAWFAWAAVVGTANLLLMGVMVFPDGPAAMVTAAVAGLLVRFALARTEVRTRDIVLVSGLLAGMPWLHTRFAVLAAGLGLATVVAVLRESGRQPRARVRRMAEFLCLPLLSAAGWFWYFWSIYGTFDPRAPYRGAEGMRDWIWGAVAGLYTDQQFGLLVFAPVLVTAAVGALRAAGAVRLVWRWFAGILVAYTLTVSSYYMWWAGLPGLPARFLTAALPLLALPLAIGWTRSGAPGRSALLGVLGMTWVTTALLVVRHHGEFAFNMRDGQGAWLEWLNPLVNVPRAWPSYFWRTEGEFLVHVAVWCGVWGLSGLVVRFLVVRYARRADLCRVAFACGLLGGLMGSAEAGWRLNGVSGLDPARSQLAVHGSSKGWPAWRASTMSIGPEEQPRSDHPSPWFIMARKVPAGMYRLRVEGPRANASVLRVKIGSSVTPLAVWEVPPGGAVSYKLPLPAGAGVLLLEADSEESAARMRVFLEPTTRAIPSGGEARSSARAGPATVYFLDEHVFVEPAGLWVRGGQEARMVWSEGSKVSGRTRELHVRNGLVGNVVAVSMGSWQEVLHLAAGQEQSVQLPAADATGSWRVSVHSAAGFIPAVVSGGDDRRYLGVWINK